MTENVEHTYIIEKIIEYMREKASKMLELIIASEVLNSRVSCNASVILDDSKGD